MPLEAVFVSLLYTVGPQLAPVRVQLFLPEPSARGYSLLPFLPGPSALGHFSLPFLREPDAHRCPFPPDAAALEFLSLSPLQLLLLTPL